jgi:LytS/YehU family sensor histidine kinase
MNPHFIFNAINSIQHYVLTNEKDLANKYLVKFSKLMRNILDLSKEELISLKEELDTVTLYLEIEALRFNNAFTFEINCSRSVEKEEVRLPPLLIQPFVENAIWHGLLLKEGRKLLMIDIGKNHEGIVIKIDDNGIGRRNAMKFRNAEFNRKSLGMEITHSRLDVVRKVHGIAITYEVIDKISPNNEPEGTTVIIKLHSQKDV